MDTRGVVPAWQFRLTPMNMSSGTSPAFPGSRQSPTTSSARRSCRVKRVSRIKWLSSSWRRRHEADRRPLARTWQYIARGRGYPCPVPDAPPQRSRATDRLARRGRLWDVMVRCPCVGLRRGLRPHSNPVGGLPAQATARKPHGGGSGRSWGLRQDRFSRPPSDAMDLAVTPSFPTGDESSRRAVIPPAPCHVPRSCSMPATLFQFGPRPPNHHLGNAAA